MSIFNRHPSLLFWCFVGGCLILIALCVFAVKPVSSTQLSPATSPSTVGATSTVSGWLLYRDSANVFSFQYPPTFRTLPDDGDDGVLVYPASVPVNSGAALDQGLSFTPLLTRSSDETLWQFAHNSLSVSPGIDSDQITSLNGIAAYNFEILYGKSAYRHLFLFKDEDHGLDASYQSPQYDLFASQYQAILATLTFVTSTPITLQ